MCVEIRYDDYDDGDDVTVAFFRSKCLQISYSFSKTKEKDGGCANDSEAITHHVICE